LPVYSTLENKDVEVRNPVVKVVQLRDRYVGDTAVIGVAEHEKGMIRAKGEEKGL